MFHEHMMTALDSVQSKSQSNQRSDSLFAGDGRIGTHQARPTMRLSSVSLLAASGIFLPFAVMDLI